MHSGQKVGSKAINIARITLHNGNNGICGRPYTLLEVFTMRYTIHKYIYFITEDHHS